MFFAATKNRIGRRPRGTAGTGTTPAAFYLGLCRLRAILSPPASVTTYRRRNHSPLRQRRIESDAEPLCCYARCRRAIPHCSSDDAASIRKSGLEIKNRCTQDGINRQKLASIRKSRPKIKNRCTKDGVNRQNPASIRKFGLEIKNRCTKEAINGEILSSILKSGHEITNRCRKQHIPQHAFHHALTTSLAL